MRLESWIPKQWVRLVYQVRGKLERSGQALPENSSPLTALDRRPGNERHLRTPQPQPGIGKPAPAFSCPLGRSGGVLRIRRTSVRAQELRIELPGAFATQHFFFARAAIPCRQVQATPSDGFQAQAR